MGLLITFVRLRRPFSSKPKSGHNAGPARARLALLVFLVLVATTAVACTSSSKDDVPQESQPTATATATAITADGIRRTPDPTPFPTVTRVNGVDFTVLPVVKPSEKLDAIVGTVGSYARDLGGLMRAIAPAPGEPGMAYVAVDGRIHIADLHDPENPRIGDPVAIASKDVVRLTTAEDRIAAILDNDCYKQACGDVELIYIENGLEQGKHLIQGRYRKAVLDGEFLYLASFDKGVDIYLAEVDSKPELIHNIPPARYSDEYAFTFDIVVDEDRLFIAGGLSGVAAYDVSQPWVPEFLREIRGPVDVRTPGEVAMIAVEGDTLLWIQHGRRSAFHVVDISDLHPQAANRTLDTEFWDITSNYWDFTDITIEGDRAYFVGWVDDWVSFWALGEISLTEPTEIPYIKRVMQNGAVDALLVHDGHVFLPTFTSMTVVDTKKMTRSSGEINGGEIPEAIVTKEQVRSFPSHIQIAEQHAVVFTGDNMRVFDFSFTGDLQEVARAELNGRPPTWVDPGKAFFFHDRSATHNTEEFIVLDFTTPESPEWLEPVELVWRDAQGAAGRSCRNRIVDGVCFGTSDNGVRGWLVLELSLTDGSGVRLPSVNIPDSFAANGSEVLAVDENLFVIAGTSIFVFDASDAVNPVLLTRVPLDVEPPADADEYGVRPQVDIDYHNGRLYAALDGVWVFDLADPAEPRLIGHHEFDAVKLSANDDFVAAVSAEGHVEVLSVRMRTECGDIWSKNGRNC